MKKYISKTYHRNLIEKLLKENIIQDSVLDIGSKDRRYDSFFSGNVTACDVIPNKELNVEKQDVTELTYRDNTFDGVICLEVLEYLEAEDLKKALSEIRRVSKGNCLISIPFYYKDHEDNIRVTFSYLEKILKELGFSYEIKKIGNRFTSSYDITRYSFLKNKIVFPLLLSKLALIKLFFLDKKIDDFYSGIFIILKNNV